MRASEVIAELSKIYHSKFVRAMIKGDIIRDVGNTPVLLLGKKFQYFGKVPKGFTRRGRSIVCANEELVEILDKIGVQINVMQYE